MATKETKNFILYSLRHPANWIKFLVFAMAFLYKLVHRKIFKSIAGNYPSRASSVLTIGRTYNCPATAYAQAGSPLGFPYHYKTSLCEYIADKDFSWNQISDQQLDDPEIINSIHRWYWLVYDPSKELPADTIISLAKHWIAYYGYNPEGIEWEAYTVSERISSLTTALLLKLPFAEVQEIAQKDPAIHLFLKRSVYQLTQRLEYYPGGLSYNHVVNDLKGVLSAAVLLGDESLVNTSAELFFQEIILLVNKEGFIREGSSHYQLVMTRWLVELEWLCLLAGRKELQLPVRHYTASMLDACRFLFVQDENSGRLTIPLFGDVSPDFDPEWMISYYANFLGTAKSSPHTYSNAIWEKLNHMFPVVETRAGVEQYTVCSRINYGPWIVFIRHQPSNEQFLPGHAHDDYGSYIIFFKGAEVVGDPGRVHYMTNEHSVQYIQYPNHNVIGINGLAIQVTEWQKHFFAPYYKKNHSSATFFSDENQAVVLIKTDAVKRITDCSLQQYERELTVTADTVKVRDGINGSGQARITEQITLHPGIEVSASGEANRQLQLSGGHTLVVQGTQKDWIKETGYYSQQYGGEIATQKIVAAHTATLPFNSSIQFKLSS